jgi:hypothetical protein
MDGSADGTLHDTIEEKKQYWVAIFIIFYTNSRIFNKREQAKIREDMSKGFDVTLKKRFEFIIFIILPIFTNFFIL